MGSAVRRRSVAAPPRGSESEFYAHLWEFPAGGVAEAALAGAKSVKTAHAHLDFGVAQCQSQCHEDENRREQPHVPDTRCCKLLE